MNLLHKLLMAAAKKRAAGGGGGDPYWANVRWVLDFTPGTAVEAKNGYTTSLHNDASLAVGGLTVPAGAGGGYLKINNVAAVGLDDYVLECYFDPADLGWTYTYLFNTIANQGQAGVTLYLHGTSPNTYAHALATDRSIRYDAFSLAASTTHHAALVRTGADLSFYINGNRIWTGPNDYNTVAAHNILNHFIGGNEETAGYGRGPTVTYKAARLTVGTNRGYTGATITPDAYPYATN